MQKKAVKCTIMQARNVYRYPHWAVRYSTWLLSKLTPTGVVFSFAFRFFLFSMAISTCFSAVQGPSWIVVAD